MTRFYYLKIRAFFLPQNKIHPIPELLLSGGEFYMIKSRIPGNGAPFIGPEFLSFIIIEDVR